MSFQCLFSTHFTIWLFKFKIWSYLGKVSQVFGSFKIVLKTFSFSLSFQTTLVNFFVISTFQATLLSLFCVTSCAQTHFVWYILSVWRPIMFSFLIPAKKYKFSTLYYYISHGLFRNKIKSYLRRQLKWSLKV